MQDDNSRSPRRRPVDVLFGEQVELTPKPSADPKTPVAQTPGYMVEAPRPVTNLRPPPPEFPNAWHATTPPEVVTAFEPPPETLPVSESISAPPIPVMIEPPPVEPIAEAVSFTVPERIEPPTEIKAASVKETAPAAPFQTVGIPMPIVVAAAQPAPVYGQPELVELSQFVDQLYQNVADETSDSAALNAECLEKLNVARASIERGEYAPAETAAEQVKARLLLARTSRAAASSTNTLLVLGWLVAALGVALLLFLLPFAVRLVPAVIPLLRGIAMGMLGGAVTALWGMTRHIGARTFVPDMTLKYGIAPLLGAACGAVLYLLSLLGILAAPGALGIPGEPWLMYLFAFIAGLFSEQGITLIMSRRMARRG